MPPCLLQGGLSRPPLVVLSSLPISSLPPRATSHWVSVLCNQKTGVLLKPQDPSLSGSSFPGSLYQLLLIFLSPSSVLSLPRLLIRAVC